MITKEQPKKPENAYFCLPLSKDTNIPLIQPPLIMARHLLYLHSYFKSLLSTPSKPANASESSLQPLVTFAFWENRGKIQSHWSKGWERDGRKEGRNTQALSCSPVWSLPTFYKRKMGNNLLLGSIMQEVGKCPTSVLFLELKALSYACSLQTVTF